MMEKIFSVAKSVFFLSFMFIAGFSADAQVRVVKSAEVKNPTLLFSGVAGNPQLSELVASDLKNCGWFDIVSGGSADYRISGNAGGASVSLNVNGIDNFSIQETVDSSNLNWTAHRAVDQILKKLFKIQGVCCSKIAFCVELRKGVKEIYICDFDGKNGKKITSNNTLSVEPDWGPRSRTIVYTVYLGNNVNIGETDLFSRRSRVLVHMPGLNSGAAYSPDGRILALTLSYDRTVELYLKTAEGKSLRRLTNSIAVEASPCWSPRGDKICFVSDQNRAPQLYVIGAGGGSPVRLNTIGTEAVSPAWSADDKIAYSAKMGGNYTIAVLDMKGNTPSRSVINAAGNWESPSWAPDGRHIVCMHTAGGRSSLYIVDSWTGKLRPLIGGGKFNYSLPSWSGIFR